MVIAGFSYECLYADVGTNSRVNDCGVWNKYGSSKALENKKISLASPRCLPVGVQNIAFIPLNTSLEDQT